MDSPIALTAVATVELRTAVATMVNITVDFRTTVATTSRAAMITVIMGALLSLTKMRTMRQTMEMMEMMMVLHYHYLGHTPLRDNSMLPFLAMIPTSTR
jgi:hypothetical protein